MIRINKWGIYLILIASLLIKIGFTTFIINNNPNGMWAADSSSYWNPALSLLHNHTFSSSPDAIDKPETIRTPGYPFFLFLVIKCFGKSPVPVILVQIIMSLITIYLTFRLGEIVFNRKAGIFAGLFAAIDLTAIASCQMILTETLFDLFIVLGVLFTVKWFIQINENKKADLQFLQGVEQVQRVEPVQRVQSVQSLFIACCCFSGATLVRPVLYYYFPLLWLFFIIYGIKQGFGKKQFAILIFAVFVPAIVIVGLWQVRNFCLTGNAGISSIQGKNLLYYRGAGVYAMKNGISINKARQILETKFFDKYPDMINASSALKSPLESKEGIEIILKNPVTYLKIHLRGSVNMMLNPGSFRIMNLIGADFGKDNEANELSLHDRFFELGFFRFFLYLATSEKILLISLIGAGFMLGFFYLCAVIGIITTGKNIFSFSHLFVILIILYLLGISGGPESHDRFREPVMPLLSIYAGYGICWIESISKLCF